MKKLIKIICLILSFSILSFCFTGCSKKTPTPTKVTDYSNLDMLYNNLVASSITNSDSSNKNITFIAIDTSSMAGLSSTGKASVISLLKKYNSNVIEASFISLEEKGMRDSSGSIKGILIYIERTKIVSSSEIDFTLIKYTSTTAQTKYKYIATYKTNAWTIKSA